MGPFDVVDIEDRDRRILHGSWILMDATGAMDRRSDGRGFHLGCGLRRPHGRLRHGVGHRAIRRTCHGSGRARRC